MSRKFYGNHKLRKYIIIIFGHGKLFVSLRSGSKHTHIDPYLSISSRKHEHELKQDNVNRWCVFVWVLLCCERLTWNEVNHMHTPRIEPNEIRRSMNWFSVPHCRWIGLG